MERLNDQSDNSQAAKNPTTMKQLGRFLLGAAEFGAGFTLAGATIVTPWAPVGVLAGTLVMIDGALKIGGAVSPILKDQSRQEVEESLPQDSRLKAVAKRIGSFVLGVSELAAGIAAAWVSAPTPLAVLGVPAGTAAIIDGLHRICEALPAVTLAPNAEEV
ncbi:MAG TPA: hypothetical protein VN778_03505 [Verrucomicrobiae bacterium]|nr:hypothetical protein [Verrucomicrobiae bacterium]